MKKLLPLFLSFILLAGCTSSREITPKLDGITFEAEISYYNESYSLLGATDKEGNFTAEMLSPDELKDLKITLDGESVKVDYKGLTYTAIEGTMPFSKVLSDIYYPLSETIKNPPEVKKDGKIKGQGYTLTLSPTGLPQSIELPDERFSVKFYNVTISED